jgi:hypothetical protein
MTTTDSNATPGGGRAGRPVIPAAPSGARAVGAETARLDDPRDPVPPGSGRRPLPPAPPTERGRPKRVVRRRVTVRRVDPWSVLKLSVIFYFCTLLVLMLAVALLWALVRQLGLVETLTEFLGTLQIIVVINAPNIARALFLIGLLSVVLLSGLNVFLCFLYNLVADLIGGLRLTLAEEE